MVESNHHIVTEELLSKLFDRWQRVRGQPTKALMLYISGRDGKHYFETHGEKRQQLHAALQNAENQGAIRLKWGKHAASHELEKILLADGVKLSEYLGKPLAIDCTEKLSVELLPLLANSPHLWVIEAFNEACDCWRCGKSFARLSLPQDHLRAKQLFIALLTVANGSHKGLDMRTFSAQKLGDSKAFEKMKASFCAIWAKNAGLDDWDNDDLLKTLGIEKEPHPALLRGPLQIQLGTRSADLSEFHPYVGIPRELLSNITPQHSVTYVLTIENLASFSLYTKEISDNGIVIYTNGYPNPDVQKLISNIGDILSDSIPFFHWGDTDVDGIAILSLIGNSIPSRNVIPHLMQRGKWNASRKLNDLEKRKISTLKQQNAMVDLLINNLAIYGIPKDFEQENISPQPPSV